MKMQFVVCLRNSGNQASLEGGKLYEVLPDEEATKHGSWRVIDESGEGYWHATDMFYQIEIPSDLVATLHGLYQAA